MAEFCWFCIWYCVRCSDRLHRHNDGIGWDSLHREALESDLEGSFKLQSVRYHPGNRKSVSKSSKLFINKLHL